MAKYILKRKTFAFLGIGNMTKNFKAAGSAIKQMKPMSALKSGAKAIGTAGVYGTTAAGIGAGLLANSDAMTGEVVNKKF